MTRLTTAILSLTVGCLVAAAASAQISPGPLAAPHAELEGSRHCFECHASGEGVDAARCLSCHRILAERIADGAGLHARPGHADCRLCHIDHHGRDYQLIWWGEEGIERFDHRLTGEPLAGAHRTLDCRQCHRAGLVQQPQRLRAAGKDLDRTFLGLVSACRACHSDEHRGQFGEASCERCHTAAAWTPASGFDHEAAAFALTGRHRQVACADCHRVESDAAGGRWHRFRPVAHQQCSDCHRDAHRGALGPRCDSCHGTESWLSTPGFDHDATRYPLTGRHRRVACAACHRRSDGAMVFQNLPFASCSDCHADPHQGRLGADCASCHATADWSRVTEGRFDHSITAFALEGAHRPLDCGACHRPGAPLRIAGFERCATCHADEHLGQLAHRGDGGACDSCHSIEAFLPALFSEEDHRDTRFPLAGLHRGVACSDCHPETAFRRVGGDEVVETAKLRFASLACSGCHADPHDGTTERWAAEAGCAACHGDAGWPVATFDHTATGFPLEGKHLETSCVGCHAPAEPVAEGRIPLLLSGTPTACADCHAEPHGGQFRDRPGGCAACHTALSWAELSFDHARDSAYPLDGAHARAPCGSCHLPEPGEGRPVVRYTPLPTDCESCHRSAA